MIQQGQIYKHTKLECLVEIKNYKGGDIASFFLLNDDTTRQIHTFYSKKIERIGVGNVKYLLNCKTNKQLELF